MQTVPIRVRRKTRDSLKKLKVNRQTYDDVLNRLIKLYEEDKK